MWSSWNNEVWKPLFANDDSSKTVNVTENTTNMVTDNFLIEWNTILKIEGQDMPVKIEQRWPKKVIIDPPKWKQLPNWYYFETDWFSETFEVGEWLMYSMTSWSSIYANIVWVSADRWWWLMFRWSQWQNWKIFSMSAYKYHKAVNDNRLVRLVVNNSDEMIARLQKKVEHEKLLNHRLENTLNKFSWVNEKLDWELWYFHSRILLHIAEFSDIDASLSMLSDSWDMKWLVNVISGLRDLIYYLDYAINSWDKYMIADTMIFLKMWIDYLVEKKEAFDVLKYDKYDIVQKIYDARDTISYLINYESRLNDVRNSIQEVEILMSEIRKWIDEDWYKIDHKLLSQITYFYEIIIKQLDSKIDGLTDFWLEFGQVYKDFKTWYSDLNDLMDHISDRFSYLKKLIKDRSYLTDLYEQASFELLGKGQIMSFDDFCKYAFEQNKRAFSLLENHNLIQRFDDFRAYIRSFFKRVLVVHSSVSSFNIMFTDIKKEISVFTNSASELQSNINSKLSELENLVSLIRKIEWSKKELFDLGLNLLMKLKRKGLNLTDEKDIKDRLIQLQKDFDSKQKRLNNLYLHLKWFVASFKVNSTELISFNNRKDNLVRSKLFDSNWEFKTDLLDIIYQVEWFKQQVIIMNDILSKVQIYISYIRMLIQSGYMINKIILWEFDKRSKDVQRISRLSDRFMDEFYNNMQYLDNQLKDADNSIVNIENCLLRFNEILDMNKDVLQKIIL